MHYANTLSHLRSYLFERFWLIKLPFRVAELCRNTISTRLAVTFKGNYKEGHHRFYIPNDLCGHDHEITGHEGKQYALRGYNLRYDSSNVSEEHRILLKCLWFGTVYSCSELCKNFFIYKSISENSSVSLVNKILIFLISLKISIGIEYRLKKTNNHILNNYIALCFCGHLLDLEFLKRFGFVGFERWIAKLPNSGVLSEGSSHYALIFACWISELYILVDRSTASDQELLKGIVEPLRNGMLSVLPLLETQAKICIGDISPDEPFNVSVNKLGYYLDLLREEIGLKLSKDVTNFYSTHSGKEIEGLFWITNLHSPEPYWIFFAAHQLSDSDGYLNHQHNDDMSFCYFNQESSFLLDPGRYSYNKACAKSASQTKLGSHTGIRVSYANQEPAPVKLKRFVIKANSITMYGHCQAGDIFWVRCVSLHSNFILIEDRLKAGVFNKNNEVLEVSLDWIKPSSSVKITREINNSSGSAFSKKMISSVKVSTSYEHIDTAIKESNIYLLEKSESVIVSKIE